MTDPLVSSASFDSAMIAVVFTWLLLGALAAFQAWRSRRAELQLQDELRLRAGFRTASKLGLLPRDDVN